MGFLGKIKQFFGMGTVKVQIETEPTFSVDAGVIKGNLVVTGKSDQEITDFSIKFEEEFSTGSGDNKSTSTIKWGEIKLPGRSIKTGEVVNIPFELPFTYAKSKNEAMADKGGLVGGLGKASKFLDNEKQTYQLVATADVKGATFDPNDVKTLKKS